MSHDRLITAHSNANLWLMHNTLYLRLSNQTLSN